MNRQVLMMLIDGLLNGCFPFLPIEDMKGALQDVLDNERNWQIREAGQGLTIEPEAAQPFMDSVITKLLNGETDKPL